MSNSGFKSGIGNILVLSDKTQNNTNKKTETFVSAFCIFIQLENQSIYLDRVLLPM